MQRDGAPATSSSAMRALIVRRGASAGRRCARRGCAAALYARTRLVDIHGAPLRARALVAETNYVFHYPFAATPCFLLKLRAAGGAAADAAARGRHDATRGRAASGRDRTIVAFSAICAHKLAYPTREVSFIRYQRDRSATSGARSSTAAPTTASTIPPQGARVVSGPGAAAARRDPARVRSRRRRALRARHASAPSSSTRSSRSTSSSSRSSTAGKARAPVGDTTVVRELDQYCRKTIQCCRTHARLVDAALRLACARCMAGDSAPSPSPSSSRTPAYQHLEATAGLDAHYRVAIGSIAWTRAVLTAARAIGIARAAAAGDLGVRATRVMTRGERVAVLLIAIANQARTDRVGVRRRRDGRSCVVVGSR